ncbi:MAG: hypothetical protein RL220_152 [Bacteroidota bacterium]
MKHLFTLLLAMTLSCAVFSQRYLEEIFDEVEVTTGVQYGMNATVIAYGIFGEAIPEDLIMDVYEPSGDTETSRPLILYFHTGNFLPHPQNGGPGGLRTDSTAVELCSRLARMGYVVASCDYRLGWNPIASTQDERVYTLINAAYRGVQDCRTAVRYFRKTVAEESNPFGIDESRIAVWGQGTGGYIAFAASTINDYIEDIATIDKFIWEPQGFPIPMVIESVNGDIYGTSYGINPLDSDTLCYPNHIGYSSDFNVAVNMGGAMGDISWLEDGSVPMISFHAPSDPFAPYQDGIVIVPVVNLPVVEVSGSYSVQSAANAFGNNSVFEMAETYAPGQVYTDGANLNNDGYFGLYPLVRPAGQEADSAPWEWWASDNPNNANGLATNPDMSPEKGRAFCDTIQWYAAPRLACALNLPGNPCESVGPDNDMCIDASDVNNLFDGGLNETILSSEFTNEGATGTEDLDGVDGCWIDTDEANGLDYQVDNTVWFTFEGTGEWYNITTGDCNGSGSFENSDTQMAVYQGDDCGNLALVACNDDINFDDGNYWSGVDIETADGATYYVVVDGFNYVDFGGDNTTGTFCLEVTQIFVGVTEMEEVRMHIYPNPATSEFMINTSEPIQQVRMFSIVGEMVWNQQSVNTNQLRINADNFAKGVYTIEVTTTSGTAISKVVIE